MTPRKNKSNEGPTNFKFVRQRTFDILARESTKDKLNRQTESLSDKAEGSRA
jgi:hypothetical protein